MLQIVHARRPFAPPGKDTTNRGDNAKGRHAKTRQMVTFSCFRMATFRPATRKYATFHALRFRLLFVVYLPGEAKSPFGGFSRGDLSRFCTGNTFIRHGINQPPYLSEYISFIYQLNQQSCRRRPFNISFGFCGKLPLAVTSPFISTVTTATV